MRTQSCNHILLVEPEEFCSNPETRATNPYQEANKGLHKEIAEKAIIEHQNFRTQIIARSINVTVSKGDIDTPDDIFGGNCYSTHQEGRAYIYPMMAENRRLEKRPYLTKLITKLYSEEYIDYSKYEDEGLFLEGTGSMVMDHVNRVVYASLSERTNEDMVKKWCAEMDYEPITFHSLNHLNTSVYHTDLVLYIGTEVAGFISGCVDEGKEKVLEKLSKTHDVVEFSKEQLAQMVGNSLELRNNHEEKFLIMSDLAYNSLTTNQHDRLLPYFKEIIHPAIPTIEKYGGGSARCLILELF